MSDYREIQKNVSFYPESVKGLTEGDKLFLTDEYHNPPIINQLVEIINISDDGCVTCVFFIYDKYEKITSNLIVT